MSARPEEDRLDFDSLPSLDEEWARLEAYRKANEKEKAEVQAALAKPAGERTKREHNLIAYSNHGTAAGCSSCGH
jgi:hypothetical protein